MKIVLFAAALSLGGAALAQDVPEAAVESTQVRETVVDDGSPPERDARGIPVISAPAAAPAGANEGVPAAPAGSQVVPAANQAQVFSTKPSTENYPPCTREVTDNCVQTYERGVGDPD